MQIFHEMPTYGLQIFVGEEDEKQAQAQQGERDSNTGEELRKILQQKAAIAKNQRHIRGWLFGLLFVLSIPAKFVVPAHVAVGGEIAEAGIAYALCRKISKWGEKMSEDCDAQLDATLAKLSTGERERIRWNLRCAGLIDESA